MWFDELSDIRRSLNTLDKQGVKIMSALTDLQAIASKVAGDITTVQTTVNTALTLIQNLQNGTTNPDDPQVEAVVAQLQAADATLEATNSSLSAAVTTTTTTSTATSAVASAAIKS
jgi:paraquat-inducible protein B